MLAYVQGKILEQLEAQFWLGNLGGRGGRDGYHYRDIEARE